MATESDLRDLLRGPDPEGRGEIDLDAVLSRTRRRRRPRMIAAQALGSVALIGVLGTAVIVSIPPAPSGVMMTAEDADGGESAATAPEADESGLTWAPDACGAPVTDVPASDILGLVVDIPTTVDPGERLPVTITLTNDGPDRVTGSTSSAPHLSLSFDGTVVWHSYAVQDANARVVDLESGESMTYESYVDRVLCGSEDDVSMNDPESTMPLAGPGDYEIRAVLVIGTDDGASIVASAPPLPLEIR